MLLATERVHHRRLEALAYRQKLIVSALASRAAQDRDPAVAVQQRRETIDVLPRWHCDRRRRQQPADLGRWGVGGFMQCDVAGHHQHRDAALADCLTDRDLEHARHLVGD